MANLKTWARETYQEPGLDPLMKAVRYEHVGRMINKTKQVHSKI